MAGGRAPQCADCGSLERHRALGSFLDAWRGRDIARHSIISFGEALPQGLAKRFRAARRARDDESLDGGYDIAVAPMFTSLLQEHELAAALGRLVSPLEDDGALILIDRKDASVPASTAGGAADLTMDDRLRLLVAEHIPNAVVQARTLDDHVTGRSFLFVQATA